MNQKREGADEAFIRVLFFSYRPTTQAGFLLSGARCGRGDAAVAADLAEDGEEGGIEDVPRIRLHDLQGPLVRVRRTVRAVSGERVVDVGHAQDARGERDVLAGQLRRVAAAVPGLVVV